MPAVVKEALQFVIWLMMLAIFGSVIISWLRSFRVHIPYYHPVVRAIEGAADLMLGPIRRNLPVATGGLDFSPMIAILILWILQALIAKIP